MVLLQVKDLQLSYKIYHKKVYLKHIMYVLAVNYFRKNLHHRWNKVFKNGPTKIFGRQRLKNLKDMVCLSWPYPFKFCKGCLPQILLGPFLNTWSEMCDRVVNAPLGVQKIFGFVGIFRKKQKNTETEK